MPEPTIPGLEALLEHRSWVRDVARRLVRDAAAAEDLAQEAWVRVMRSPPDPDRDPRPWLRRVLRNLASNRWRGERRREARESAWRDRRTQRTPAELVAEAEQHQRLVRRVLDLEEPFKTTLVLRFYEGLSPREIAERLGVAEGTVHSRVARALGRLRDRLDEEAGGDRKRWIAALLPLARFDGSAPTAVAAATTLTGVALMITKSKLALLSVLALVAVVVGGVWLAAESDGGASDAESGPTADLRTEPTLAGRAGGLRAEPAPRAEVGARPPTGPDLLVGRVVGARGEPVPGAEVFILPPGISGVDADQTSDPRFALARTDAEGAFRLEPAPAAGRLVAFATDRLPASLSVADVAPGEPVELVLGDSREITLRVEDPEGRWPAGCEVALDTDPSRTWERTSDPRELAWFGFVEPEPTPREAEQSVRIPTLAPLRIDVRPPRGWAAVPRSIDLASDQDRADFRLVRSGTLRLRVVDDLTGEAPPGDQGVSVVVTDLGAQAIAWSLGGRRSDFDLQSRLSPGRYRVDATVSGYLPASAGFEVRSPGERVDLVVRVEPRHGSAIGRVLLRVAEGEPASEPIRALARSGAPAGLVSEYVVLLRESGQAQWVDAMADALPDGRIDLRPLLLETEASGLHPGVYDVYVVRRDSGTAAFLPGLRVFGGQDNEIAVTLRPGSLFRVTDVVPRGAKMETLEVRVPETGSLPPIHLAHDGRWTLTSATDFAELLRAPLQPRVLGPFPADEIEITLRAADGETTTVRVRGAAVLR